MATKTRLYGAYGSNTNIKQMASRCPKAKVIGKAILNRYKLTFRGNYKGVANVEPCKDKKVPLVIWEITEECEKALDRYEGFPYLYIKKEVEVPIDGEVKKVMLYIMIDKYKDEPAPPTEYYFNIIARGYTDNNINLRTLQIAYSECLLEL